MKTTITKSAAIIMISLLVKAYHLKLVTAIAYFTYRWSKWKEKMKHHIDTSSSLTVFMLFYYVMLSNCWRWRTPNIVVTRTQDTLSNDIKKVNLKRFPSWL